MPVVELVQVVVVMRRLFVAHCYLVRNWRSQVEMMDLIEWMTAGNGCYAVMRLMIRDLSCCSVQIRQD